MSNKVLADSQALWGITCPIKYWTNSAGSRKPSTDLQQHKSLNTPTYVDRDDPCRAFYLQHL